MGSHHQQLWTYTRHPGQVYRSVANDELQEPSAGSYSGLKRGVTAEVSTGRLLVRHMVCRANYM